MSSSGRQPLYGGGSTPYIATTVVGFAVVGLLMVGYAQEDAAKKKQSTAVVSAPDVRPGMTTNKQPNYIEDPEAGKQYVLELARKYGDNFDKLPMEDQVFLNGMTSGHGRQLLRSRVLLLKEEAEKAKKKETNTAENSKTSTDSTASSGASEPENNG